MNQTVAVTGATGFIGKYIIDNHCDIKLYTMLFI